MNMKVTLDNSKYTGPSLNFDRSKVRVFKSPEIFGLIDRFKIYSGRNFFCQFFWHLFHTWATLTNNTRYLTRDRTPLALMAYISIILYTFIFLIQLALWHIFLIDNTFSAADMGFNCFQLLIKCRLLSLSIFKMLVEIHLIPVVRIKIKRRNFISCSLKSNFYEQPMKLRLFIAIVILMHTGQRGNGCTF